MKCVRLFIEGKVQGVFFRRFVKSEAISLDLKGYVRNLDDGRVEAAFYGPEKIVDLMVQKCWKGPELARVDDIKSEECDSSFDDFRRL